MDHVGFRCRQSRAEPNTDSTLDSSRTLGLVSATPCKTPSVPKSLLRALPSCYPDASRNA
jgi:hypothetical protein